MRLRREHGELTRPLIRAFAQVALLSFIAAAASAQPEELHLAFSPENTSVSFTLGDVLHTVHGSFKLKQGNVNYKFGTSAVQGQLVIDATSGESGNHSRDHKMHREILESARYPDIVFLPDRVQGNVAPTGASTVQVHGMFSIHGTNHEITVPVRVELSPEHWTADTHFTIPYVKWGIKNPSTFLLRVSESVEIEIHATGSSPFPAGTH